MVWFTVTQAKTTLVEHIPTTINEDPTKGSFFVYGGRVGSVILSHRKNWNIMTEQQFFGLPDWTEAVFSIRNGLSAIQLRILQFTPMQLRIRALQTRWKLKIYQHFFFPFFKFKY